MNYTILIPVYNEEKTIHSVLDELGKPDGCREIIVVDDGSTDNTKQVLQGLSHISVLSHDQNRGYGRALKTGIQAVKTEYVVLYDGDGQHTVENLQAVVNQMEGHDMVIGTRSRNSPQDWKRRFGKWILRAFIHLFTNSKIVDFNSGLRSFKTKVIHRYLHLMPDGFSFSTTSTVGLIKMGYRVGFVPIDTHTRQGRNSSVKIVQDGLNVLMLVIHLTVLFDPMRVFLPSSLFLMFSSIAYFCFYSVTVRVHITPSMSVLFLTGLIIFFLGIICEQISNIRRELNHLRS